MGTIFSNEEPTNLDQTKNISNIINKGLLNSKLSQMRCSSTLLGKNNNLSTGKTSLRFKKAFSTTAINENLTNYELKEILSRYLRFIQARLYFFMQ